MRPLITLVVLLVACNGKSSGGADAPGNGGDGNNHSDGNNNNADAAIDGAGSGSGTITISGITSEVTTSGRTPVGGVTVAAYRASDDSLIATTTSSTATATKGQFTLTAAVSGAIDGYLEATAATYITSYLYPPKPISMDYTGATVLILKPATFTSLQQFAGVTQTAGDGFVAVDVINAAQANVGGAVVQSTTGTVKYNNSLGIPSGSASSTASDGIGYIFNVTGVTDDVGATKSGLTFITHTIKARADVITLTQITP